MFISSKLSLRHKIKSAVKSTALSTAAALHYSHHSAECSLCLFSTPTPSVLFVCKRILSHNCDVCEQLPRVLPWCCTRQFQSSTLHRSTGVCPAIYVRLPYLPIYHRGGLCAEYKSEALHYLESGRGEPQSGGQDTIKLAGQLWPRVISWAAACVLYSGAANLLWWCYLFSPATVMTHRLEADDTDLKITCFLWRIRNAATLDDIYTYMVL